MEYGTCRGHDRMVLLCLLIQSVVIINKIMSLILTCGKLYSIQDYTINLSVSCGRLVIQCHFMVNNFYRKIAEILNLKNKINKNLIIEINYRVYNHM